MDLTQYRALSFDCYGTLIDWEAGIAATLVPWAARSGLQIDQETLLVVYSAHEAAVEKEHPEWPYPLVLAESLRRVGRELGAPVTDAEVEAFGASVPDWPAFPDSAEALARLKRHYELVILSNVHRAGFAGSSARLGVEFDDVLTAQDVGSYKPNPANFDALLTRNEERDRTPDQLLHVAQSLFHDHVPARTAGLAGVWINRRHDQPGWGATPDPGAPIVPDAEYPSLAAFADAVEDAFGTGR